MKLRLGLIGTGEAWESRYLPALRALSDKLEVRAVCEPVAKRAEQVAAQFGAAAVDGYRELAAREDVDAVLVLSTQWYGPLPILAACESGKAVFCSSTLGIEATRAGEIKRRVDESGVAFMAEFPRRLAPATVRLKELIATRLGRPLLVFCHERLAVEDAPNVCCGPKPAPPTARKLVELVDWCSYVVGSEPASVFGVRHPSGVPDDEHDDYRMMSLEFRDPEMPGGVLAQISCGRYLPAQWQEAIAFRPPSAMQIRCEHGVAFIDLPSTLVWFDEAGRHMESLDSERPVGEQLLAQFHRSVTSLVRRTCDLEDAYRALSIVRAAQTSVEEGRRVMLDG